MAYVAQSSWARCAVSLRASILSRPISRRTRLICSNVPSGKNQQTASVQRARAPSHSSRNGQASTLSSHGVTNKSCSPEGTTSETSAPGTPTPKTLTSGATTYGATTPEASANGSPVHGPSAREASGPEASAYGATTHQGRQNTSSEAKPRFDSPLLADVVRKKMIDKMVRVDHAGELGARQIYAGQLAVFDGTPVGKVIAEMAEQERKHLDAFDRLIVERRVRPTVMLPIWNVAGYALGLGTALLGKEAAMACTVAVEEVIAQHYNDQVRTLLDWDNESQLRAMFREFRDDELEHKDTGIHYDAERAPFYRAMSNVIKTGCRAAIMVSERV